MREVKKQAEVGGVVLIGCLCVRPVSLGHVDGWCCSYRVLVCANCFYSYTQMRKVKQHVWSFVALLVSCACVCNLFLLYKLFFFTQMREVKKQAEVAATNMQRSADALEASREAHRSAHIDIDIDIDMYI